MLHVEMDIFKIATFSCTSKSCQTLLLRHPIPVVDACVLYEILVDHFKSRHLLLHSGGELLHIKRFTLLVRFLDMSLDARLGTS